MDDLKFIPTQVLIDELKGRFDVFIAAGQQINVYGSADVVFRRSWKGDHLRCIGLCENVKFYINQEQNQMSSPLPPGEA